MQPSSQYRSGLVYGLIAYLCWGAVPLYFVQVKAVSPVEILAHRIGWSMPLMLLVTALTPGGVANLVAVFRSRKLLLTLLLSSALLSGNWLLYIYATATERVAEASLGYFILPLVNAVLATAFLGERLRPAHYPALTLIAVGVAIPMVANGLFPASVTEVSSVSQGAVAVPVANTAAPWLAVSLAVSFGFYGLVRKQVAVDGPTGLTVETLLLFVPCAGLVTYRLWDGTAAFGSDARLTGWLVFGGAVTVVPLLTYTLSLRRLPLLTQVFIQFISPSVQLLLAVTVLKEQMTWDRWAAMGCVWAAVGVFAADAVVRTRQVRRQVKGKPPVPVAA